ncbi:hypothetical protein [Nannocystis pusilla]|uniref:hypothetical protein n=1 Tax=Nannocystis pusilla TaxID=889268 RepID=UPI003B7FE864
MTAPVEGWIRRAGERCLAAGLNEIGNALVAHARHEAGHDAMMVDDTRSLAARREQAGRPVPRPRSCWRTRRRRGSSATCECTRT